MRAVQERLLPRVVTCWGLMALASCSHDPLQPVGDEGSDLGGAGEIRIEPEKIEAGARVLLTDLTPDDPDFPARSYYWTACEGTIEPGGAGSDGRTAVWMAPQEPGSYAVTMVSSTIGAGGWVRQSKVLHLCVGGEAAAAAAEAVFRERGIPHRHHDAECPTAANSDPVFTNISATPDNLVGSGDATLVSSAADPEGDSLTYGWTAQGGELSSLNAPSVQWKLPPVSCCTEQYTASVTVCDGRGGAAADAVTVTVYPN